MAWIESHQALGHHPKTIRLAATLRIRVPEAVGLLHFLWWWALDYAPDGVLSADDKLVVARECLWHGKPDRFWDALLDVGFTEIVDGGERIKFHDWMDYAGRLIDRRRKDVERKRNVRGLSGGHPGEPAVEVRRTVPNQPDSTGDVAAAGSNSGQGPRPRARGDGGFQKVGAFLIRPPSMTATAAAAADESLPDEVRERLQQPPMSSHAVG